jgi:hypothetical protein
MRMEVPTINQPVRQEGKFLQVYARPMNGARLLARDIWNANASPQGR